MRAGHPRPTSGAALGAALCACVNLLAAPAATAEDQTDAPPAVAEGHPDAPPATVADQSAAATSAAKDQPDAPTAVEKDQSDAPTLVVEDRSTAPAMAAWFGCSTQAAAQLDDGRSDAGTIADALSTSCQPEWDASKAEQCQASELSVDACAMLSDKLDANRRSYEIKVVLSFRSKKAQAAAP